MGKRLTLKKKFEIYDGHFYFYLFWLVLGPFAISFPVSLTVADYSHSAATAIFFTPIISFPFSWIFVNLFITSWLCRKYGLICQECEKPLGSRSLFRKRENNPDARADGKLPKRCPHCHTSLGKATQNLTPSQPILWEYEKAVRSTINAFALTLFFSAMAITGHYNPPFTPEQCPRFSGQIIRKERIRRSKGRYITLVIINTDEGELELRAGTSEIAKVIILSQIGNQVEGLLNHADKVVALKLNNKLIESYSIYDYQAEYQEHIILQRVCVGISIVLAFCSLGFICLSIDQRNKYLASSENPLNLPASNAPNTP